MRIFLFLLFTLNVSLALREYKKEDVIRLREEVREMFQHAYDSYLNYAYPYDELRPLSCDGMDTWGSYSLTLIDALDSLAIMGNNTEFNRVVDIVLQRKDFDTDINVSVFETNIRIIGGLLSAHLLSHRTGMKLEPGWPCNGPLLRLAEDVAQRLIAAFDTTTGMPYGTINLKTGVPPGETSVTCTAGVGTFIIEFGTLSRLTGDPLYEENEEFAQLLLKRKKLLDLREKARELNNIEIEDDRQLVINHHGSKELPQNNSLQTHPKIVPSVHECPVSFEGYNENDYTPHLKEGISDPFRIFCDYDSDDSVKDKHFEPYSDTDCSHVSGSPEIAVKKRKIYQVKRKIFTPVKTREEDCPDLITLEDLLGPPKVQNIQKVPDDITNFNNLNFQHTPLQSQKSASRILTVAMIHSNDTSSSCISARKLEDLSITTAARRHSTSEKNLEEISFYEDTPVSMNHLTNKEIPNSDIQVMIATTDGIIYLPSGYNQETNNIVFLSNSRKRVRNTAAWKRVAAKNARAKGSPYHSSVARIIPEIKGRQLKDPCSCKSKCYEKISQASRLKIFNQFWKISYSWEQRRQFVALNVIKDIKVSMKTSGDLITDRRKFTYRYSLISDYETVTVCKIMFLNTLCVGEKFVKLSINKQLDSGMTVPDLRGRHVPTNKTSEIIIKSIVDHINLFPSYESHYTRQKINRKFLGPELSVPKIYNIYKELMKEQNVATDLIGKLWIYRHIFNTKFNLSFKLPSADTCDDCDSFVRKLLDVTDATERERIERQREEHDKLAEKRYDLKRQDRAEAKISRGKKIVLMIDMQKCMATPNLTNSKSFYLRKLWTLNLTILETERNIANNMIWSENIGARGGNEVASCLLRWVDENHALISDIDCLTIWSDNCGGQNRNTMIVMVYLWLLKKHPHIQTINHKFLLKGHTHMEVDQVHSQIERKKNTLKTMEIAIPREWSQFIRTCSGSKRKFLVYDMDFSHFKDFTSLHKKNAPYILRKKNIDGYDFKISECVWLQLRKETPGILHYKTNFDEEFLQVSFLRTANHVVYPDHLPQLRYTQKEISEAKYRDLLKLLEWVPIEYHTFYKDLPHNDEETDFPETD